MVVFSSITAVIIVIYIVVGLDRRATSFYRRQLLRNCRDHSNRGTIEPSSCMQWTTGQPEKSESDYNSECSLHLSICLARDVSSARGILERIGRYAPIQLLSKKFFSGQAKKPLNSASTYLFPRRNRCGDYYVKVFKLRPRTKPKRGPLRLRQVSPRRQARPRLPDLPVEQY
jgi:hypothetical protein